MPINQFSVEERLWWKQPMMDPTPKIPSSIYKGVVIPQPNALLGAQISDQHHPIWQATVDTQQSAASMFTGRETILNFSPTHEEDEVEDAAEKDEEPDDDDEVEEEEREHMFEKPLTPSDVGKLNRLVIPKQYAEKYFPLGGDSGEKGLLLGFEDELGKSWRFRYSYWNSSQSYVLTKGWSRFVKEKRLDAGDVVLFDRCRYDGDRLFIGWRRRAVPVQGSGVAQDMGGSATTTTGAWTRMFYHAHPPYPSHPHGSLLYQPDSLHAGVEVEAVVQQNQATPGNSKRLRLFGVNLDCQLDETEPCLSSQGRAHFAYSQPNSSNHDHHVDSNSSIDVIQPRNRRRNISM